MTTFFDRARSALADRFLREIGILAALNHPNIVPLFDSGRIDDIVFFVMPYIEGESLEVRLAREGPFPVAEAIRVACEIAEALSYAHEKNVVHRDIKPANVRGKALGTILLNRSTVSGRASSDRPAVNRTGISKLPRTPERTK